MEGVQWSTGEATKGHHPPFYGLDVWRASLVEVHRSDLAKLVGPVAEGIMELLLNLAVGLERFLELALEPHHLTERLWRLVGHLQEPVPLLLGERRLIAPLWRLAGWRCPVGGLILAGILGDSGWGHVLIPGSLGELEMDLRLVLGAARLEGIGLAGAATGVLLA